MSDIKTITLLACSVGICMAATAPPAGPAPEDPVIQSRETLLPRQEKAPRHGKPEKRPTPPENQTAPVKEEPDESPEGSEDKADCDECVLVRGPPSGEALATTLWGLFCVGRPRWFPRTRIRGLSAT